MKKDLVTSSDFYLWGFGILDKWLQIKSLGGNLKPFFSDNYIKSVSIYGMGTLGKRLLEELRTTGIDVLYGIDKKVFNIRINGLNLYSPDDKLPEVDAVIVTPIFFYEIEELLQKRIGANTYIISIEDVIDYCFE